VNDAVGAMVLWMCHGDCHGCVFRFPGTAGMNRHESRVVRRGLVHIAILCGTVMKVLVITLFLLI
jgi:hypothetical protein